MSRDVTELKSECRRIPTIFLQIRNPTDFHTQSDLDSAFVLKSPSSSLVAMRR